jgi:tripartite-type tricarboxylate transporter receptor subunit TctC
MNLRPVILIAVIVQIVFAPAAHAYPDKPVRFIVP